MDLKQLRTALIMSLIFIGVMLFTTYQRERAMIAESQVSSPVNVGDVPNAIEVGAQSSGLLSGLSSDSRAVEKGRAGGVISVVTEELQLKIDLNGGDIVFAALPKYPKAKGDEDPYILLDQTAERFSIAQSGLISQSGPDTGDTRGVYKAPAENINEAWLSAHDWVLPLTWHSDDGHIKITKSYKFTPDSYLLDISFNVENTGRAAWEGRFYNQIKRQPSAKKKSAMIGSQVFEGGAYYTEKKPYQKISFDKMKSSPVSQTVTGGYAAMIEHYFLTAWVPDVDTTHHYFTRGDANKNFYIGSIDPTLTVMPGETKSVSTQLYIGPEETDVLRTISPGLELTVDYGILWPISQLLFWIMKHIYAIVGNWGLAIIGVTLCIKMVFFRLSASSYRSMGNMRRIQPLVLKLRESCADDKQRLSQEMMDLYRREKVNPLGGCLPILIQIPVFIALYYVLLASVELRQAPFFGWIQDLSSKDPYYILPVLMGASMVLQQRLNPAPPDPLQAKLLMFMPIFFTVLFLKFPSGLILYWFVNNCLSILQQWVITRKITSQKVTVIPKMAR